MFSKGFFGLLKRHYKNDGNNGPIKYRSRSTTWELSMVLNSASRHWTVFPHLVTGSPPCRANPRLGLYRCVNEHEHGFSLPAITTLSLSWFPHELRCCVTKFRLPTCLPITRLFNLPQSHYSAPGHISASIQERISERVERTQRARRGIG